MKTIRLALLFGAVMLAVTGGAQAMYAPGNSPFVNTWLVAGPFENDASNIGFEKDWIGEERARPAEGAAAGNRQWTYFDDRLFSRNYDDYQDLYSYYTIVKRLAPVGRVVYAHVYVYVASAVAAELRVGADSEFKAWVNGVSAGRGESPAAGKDAALLPVQLRRGWNSVLLKVACKEDGFFGFYARISDLYGNAVPGLEYSLSGAGTQLSIATHGLSTPGASLPAGYRGWPYVEFEAPYIDYLKNRYPGKADRIESFAQASAFQLLASGGVPPYRWTVKPGALPAGLSLGSDGKIHGRVASSARLGRYTIGLVVADSTGRRANGTVTLDVKERPNRWYQDAGLVGLVHSPEILKPTDYDGLAGLMKRQGYQAAMVISYGNGDFRFRYPSRFEPKNVDGDLVGHCKAAFDKAGIKTGMYFGNIVGCPQFRYSQVNSLLADAVQKYHPAVIYLDWCGKHVKADDAIYSAVRSASPDAVIVLNGMRRPENGDWDVLCIENMAYGCRGLAWDSWPGEFYVTEMPMVGTWPKGQALESWRYFVPTATSPSTPDWQDLLRRQISLIGDGCVADIDHSPTRAPGASGLVGLADSPGLIAHENMARWANPDGIPALSSSYTNVRQGPIASAPWGYDTVSLDRAKIYLHFIKNERGKSGLPACGSVKIPLGAAKVLKAVWMNKNQAVAFNRKGNAIALDTRLLSSDNIDTIIRLELAQPLPDTDHDAPYPASATLPVTAKNIAFHKPIKLLSLDGKRALDPCGGTMVAENANDDDVLTVAQAGGEYPWTLQLDLEVLYLISKIDVTFDRNHATEYAISISDNGDRWTTLDHVIDADGMPTRLSFPATPARYVRVQGIKPDGPNQPGGQMAIAELRVYE